MIPIRLLGPKVLVALEPKATAVEDTTGMNYQDKGRSDGGLIILAQPTDMYDPDEHSRGLVVALGDKRGLADVHTVKALAQRAEDFPSFFKALDRLIPVPFDVQVNDVVLFSPSAGISIGEQDDGITYVILQEHDLIAILDRRKPRLLHDRTERRTRPDQKAGRRRHR